MELKKYQQYVINDLEEYLQRISEYGDYKSAYKNYWLNHSRTPIQENNIDAYKNGIIDCPNVCIKVPTA